MTSYRKLEDGMMALIGENGEEIELFESSGCLYRDLGCCQGCPTCAFDDEDEDEEDSCFADDYEAEDFEEFVDETDSCEEEKKGLEEKKEDFFGPEEEEMLQFF